MNIFKSDRSKVESFRESRTRLSDDDFIAACDLPDDPLAVKAALATRRVVANIGLVDSQFILPDDDFPGSLDSLPLWDSMDWVTFIMELEIELECEIGDKDFEMLTTDFTVKELTSKVYHLLMQR